MRRNSVNIRGPSPNLQKRNRKRCLELRLTTSMEEAVKTFAQTAIQDSHIIHHPSPSRDVAPSTSADQQPITVPRRAFPSIQFSSSRADLNRLAQQVEADEVEETASEISLDESAHRHHHRHPRPKPRRPQLPPLPDLRFEQAYLKQLEAANGSVFWMAIITIREQVLFPGLQGFLWALALTGIRTIRVNQAESGRTFGGWLRSYFGGLMGSNGTSQTSQYRR